MNNYRDLLDHGIKTRRKKPCRKKKQMDRPNFNTTVLTSYKNSSAYKYINPAYNWRNI